MPCSTCRFWCPSYDDVTLPIEQTGECRVESPVADEERGRIWPLTVAAEWCGDFAPSIDGMIG